MVFLTTVFFVLLKQFRHFRSKILSVSVIERFRYIQINRDFKTFRCRQVSVSCKFRYRPVGLYFKNLEYFCCSGQD